MVAVEPRKRTDEATLLEANRRLQALVEFGRAVNAQLDLRALLELVPRELVRRGPALAAGVMLYDAESGTIGPADSSGLPATFTLEWLKAARVGPDGAGVELGTALASRRPALYGDIRHDERLTNVAPLLTRHGIRGAVGIPLIAREQFLGVLTAYFDSTDGLERDRLLDLFSMAENAAAAFHNALLYAQTRQDLRRRDALRAVVTSISSELDLGSLLERVAGSAVELLNATGGSISLVESDGAARVRAVHNLPQKFVGMRFLPGRGVTGEVLAVRGPVVVTDYHREVRRPSIDLGLVHAGVAVPIWWQGQLIGVFATFDTVVGRTFTVQDREMVEHLAKHAAIAIENARLYGEARERLAEVTGLQAASAALVEELEPERALRKVAEQALHLSGANTVSIELLSEDGREIEVRVAVGRDSDDLVGVRVPVGSSRGAAALATGQPQVLQEPPTAHDQRHGTQSRTEPGGPGGWSSPPEEKNTPLPGEGARGWGSSSLLVLPLRARGRTLGTLSAYKSQADSFRQRDVELLGTFANQAAISLDNARLYAERQGRLEEMVGIQKIGALLLQEHDFDRVLQAICLQLQSLTEAEGVGLALVEEGGGDLELRTVVGPAAAVLRGARIPLAGSFAGEALRTNQPQRSDDAPRDPRGYHPTLVLGNTRSILSVPMKTRQRSVGVLSIYNKHGGGGFTERDAELATLFANQAVVALENARLYGEARDYAVMTERARLARELHDSVTQNLFSMTLLVQAALSLWERDADKARERLERAAELAQGALTEMRQLIFQLRPMSLEGEVLPSALRKHLAALKSREGLDVRLRVVGRERRLPPEIEGAAFRIVQECLNNVAKHALVRGATVRITFQESTLGLRVTDRGVGFDVDAARAPGSIGMASMQERAENAGGTIRVTSKPGRGTRVDVELPVPPRQAMTAGAMQGVGASVMERAQPAER